MLLATTNEIAGKTVKETLGLVEGAVVQSKHIGKDIMAGFKTIVGGELKGYTEMMADARKIATERMIEEAKKLLEEAGYNVKRTGKTSSIAQTVITNKKDVTDENLKNIKQVLGKGNISTNKSSTSLVDVTIIIGKDF